MKKLIILALAIFLSVSFLPRNAVAFDPSTITFSITSAAVTSTPNVRIGVAKGNLAKDGNVQIQAMPIPKPVNYYLTKLTTHTFTAGTYAVEIQVDQATKMYSGSDLTNYLVLPAESRTTYTVR